MKEKLQDRLAYPPRAMRADRAAAYLAISRSKFLHMVSVGRLPKPTYIDNIPVWDRLSLELAFEDMAQDEANSFDRIMKDRAK